MATVTSAQNMNGPDGNAIDIIEAVIDGQTVFVPKDSDNREYQAILDWVADGNTIADAD